MKQIFYHFFQGFRHNFLSNHLQVIILDKNCKTSLLQEGGYICTLHFVSEFKRLHHIYAAIEMATLSQQLISLLVMKCMTNRT